MNYLRSLYQKVTQERSCKTLVVDVIAQFRTILKELPKTFEGLFIRFLESLPKSYSHVDLVADCHRDFSIKAGERGKRGSSKDLGQIMENNVAKKYGEILFKWREKKSTYDLTFVFMKEHPSRSLSLLKCNTIFLSGEHPCQSVISIKLQSNFIEIILRHGCPPGICKRISKESITFYEDLSSDQDEADTKMVLHALHALQTSNGNVYIWSPSGAS